MRLARGIGVGYGLHHASGPDGHAVQRHEQVKDR
jgi:hypothetical protein